MGSESDFTTMLGGRRRKNADDVGSPEVGRVGLLDCWTVCAAK